MHPRCIKQYLLLYLWVSSVAPNIAAASTMPSGAAFCQASEYHQLDFWLANWESLDSKGIVQGHSFVQKVLDGCRLQVWWRGTDGATGSRFIIFDASRRIWNQTWVSNHGTLLPIEGYKDGDSVVLLGFRLSPQGRRQLHRTLWTQLPKGTVHQLWDVSEDGGKKWTIVYEAFLRQRDELLDTSIIDHSRPK